MSNCVIITYTGSHHIVTDEQATKFAELAPDGEASFNGNLIKYKNVAEILSMDKYYEVYPNKIPARQLDFLDAPALGYRGIAKKYRYNGLAEMIQGLKNYINSTEENPILQRQTQKDGRVTFTGQKFWYQGGTGSLELLEKLEKYLVKAE